jgi:hypothetical protein
MIIAALYHRPTPVPNRSLQLTGEKARRTIAAARQAEANQRLEPGIMSHRSKDTQGTVAKSI